MNIPYGCVMVAVNESLKRSLRPAGDYDTQTFLLAGSGAGAVAAAATNPLDVVKTRLQTQALRAPAPSPAATAAVGVAGVKGEGVAVGTRGGIAPPQFLRGSGSGAAAGGGGGGGGAAGQHGPIWGGMQGTGIHSAAARCATGRCGADKPVVTLQYQGLLDAVSRKRSFVCTVVEGKRRLKVFSRLKSRASAVEGGGGRQGEETLCATTVQSSGKNTHRGKER